MSVPHEITKRSAGATRLRGDEAQLYGEHHARLVRSVTRAVNASDALIQDACAIAWEQLLRTQPERGPTLFAWLRTVAIHEAYRLSRAERRTDALEQLGTSQDDPRESWEAIIADDHDLDTHLEAKRALAILADLPDRERQYLTLFAAGFTYHEICALAQRTYTNVNKHLTRARARVRAARDVT